VAPGAQRVKPSGAILHRGPSAIDGSPVVAILTGLRDRSANVKTGPMAQTYILRADMPPADAIAYGIDTAVCGACPHRSKASGGGGTCYVNIGHGPRAVWECYAHGAGYPEVGDIDLPGALTGRGLRLGAYGEPAAVPRAVWDPLIRAAAFHTGYTHRWRDVGADLRGLCMASTDTAAETLEAQALGWSTFRVSARGDPLRLRGEARCPASGEAGRRVTCAECPIPCNGARFPGIAGRVIQAHGASGGRVIGDLNPTGKINSKKS